MKPALLVTILIFLALPSLAQNTKVENNTEYYSVTLSKNDAKFLALKDTAQLHLPQFIDSLAKHGADRNNYAFSVKTDFVEKGVHEHMWSQVFLFKDGRFEGVFIDSPFDIKNIKTGDKVSIKKSAVEDWLIENIRTGQQTGYFSKEYLKSKN